MAGNPWGGSIKRYVVVLDHKAVLDFKADVLAQWIGRDEAGH